MWEFGGRVHLSWVQIPATPPQNPEAMKETSLDKLANLIRICGFLMQTKGYLFWKKENGE